MIWVLQRMRKYVHAHFLLALSVAVSPYTWVKLVWVFLGLESGEHNSSTPESREKWAQVVNKACLITQSTKKPRVECFTFDSAEEMGYYHEKTVKCWWWHEIKMGRGFSRTLQLLARCLLTYVTLVTYNSFTTTCTDALNSYYTFICRVNRTTDRIGFYTQLVFFFTTTSNLLIHSCQTKRCNTSSRRVSISLRSIYQMGFHILFTKPPSHRPIFLYQMNKQ